MEVSTSIVQWTVPVPSICNTTQCAYKSTAYPKNRYYYEGFSKTQTSINNTPYRRIRWSADLGATPANHSSYSEGTDRVPGALKRKYAAEWGMVSHASGSFSLASRSGLARGPEFACFSPTGWGWPAPRLSDCPRMRHLPVIRTDGSVLLLYYSCDRVYF